MRLLADALIHYDTLSDSMQVSESMGMYGLRHGAVTVLLSKKVDAKVVQEILGHSHISITLSIYAHVLPGMHEEAMNKMDDWFGNDDEGNDSSDREKSNAEEKD